MHAQLTLIAPHLNEKQKEHICNLLLSNNKPALKSFISSLDLSLKEQEQLNELITRPIIKDSSFITMKNDIKEIINKIGAKYQSYHFVGTCMGGLISALYIMENPAKVASLSLFSPLFTLDDAFLNPSKNEFSRKKEREIKKYGQFHMGNQVEGIETYKEILSLRPTFYQKLFALNIPIYCLQGIKDQLVPEKAQRQIFTSLIAYHEKNNLSPVYYATIYPGVHCLYDVIYPSILEISSFISSNLTSNLQR